MPAHIDEGFSCTGEREIQCASGCPIEESRCPILNYHLSLRADFTTERSKYGLRRRRLEEIIVMNLDRLGRMFATQVLRVQTDRPERIYCHLNIVPSGQMDEKKITNLPRTETVTLIGAPEDVLAPYNKVLAER
jgi:hypothetical protein